MSTASGSLGSGRLTAAERRRQIVSEASTLFANHGFAAVTVKRIADSCGISQAILYRHFPSKEHLYFSVLEEKITKLDARAFVAALDREQPLDALLSAIALHILAISQQDPGINRLLLYGTLQGSREALALFQAWRQPFVDFVENQIARQVAAGRLRPVDAHITARAFVGMVMDCSVSCFLWPEFGYEEFDPPKAVANNVTIFMRGLQP